MKIKIVLYNFVIFIFLFLIFDFLFNNLYLNKLNTSCYHIEEDYYELKKIVKDENNSNLHSQLWILILMNLGIE